MTIAIGIVAHHKRERMADELSRQVRPTFVSVDMGTMGCNTNHLNVWGTLAKKPSDWSVVLEDDAEPVFGFRNFLVAALDAAPTPVVSLYLGRERPPQYQPAIQAATEKADADHAHWITSNHLMHAVGVAIRTDLVLDMCANHRPYLPIDQSIARWARRRSHRIAYVWPSLVDHRDTPTLFEHPDKADRAPGRRAWRTGSRLLYTDRSVDL